MSQRVKHYGTYTVLPLSDNLIDIQLQSFKLFTNELLAEVFEEYSPVVSHNEELYLYFPGHYPQAKAYQLTYWLDEPKHPVSYCIKRKATYAAPLYARIALHNRRTDEHRVETIYLCDFPLMTENGTFIINGAERVIVSQIARSPGAYCELLSSSETGQFLGVAKIIPDRGVWLEFETRKSGYIVARFNRKRIVPVTLFLRALAGLNDGLNDDHLSSAERDAIIALFADLDPACLSYIERTFNEEGDLTPRRGKTLEQEALIQLFERVRPGDPPRYENALAYFSEILFNRKRYDLGRVGRYNLNRRLGLNIPSIYRTITIRDIIAVLRRLLLVNVGQEKPDDIDHLGYRRVKTSGELLQAQVRVALKRMERLIKDRMSMVDHNTLPAPTTIINVRPFAGVVREFFGSSQLSQLIDQVNPLSELSGVRTVSAIGPGGISREHAGFDVRDVHHSHYGRICPIETPEGQNIGLITRLATYARLNPYGFIETPYRKVKDVVPNDAACSVGHTLREDVRDTKGNLIAPAGVVIDDALAKALRPHRHIVELPVKPYVSDEVVWMTADVEERHVIAQGQARLSPCGEFLDSFISARRDGRFAMVRPEAIEYIDYSPHQLVGISTALIPFVEHDEAARALMGANMQRQAVPLIRPDAPIVGTGMESVVARASKQAIYAEGDGVVLAANGREVVVQYKDKRKVSYPLRRFERTNQGMCFDQHPIVVAGQRVKKGDPLADSYSTRDGVLALGQNVLVAFLSWEGYNYEDAIVVSERLVREDLYTSIHIEQYTAEAKDTQLGPEEITRDIPNVSLEALAHLDEHGVARVGSVVSPHDILVGKLSPKGERDLSPEEKLLRAIFGDKSREVKETSLRVPHGEHGTVIDAQIFHRDHYPDLPAGTIELVKVDLAQKRKLTVGDKMAGRHGNKGVVSKIVPIEDMPFLEDGTPIDIVLNPLGVPGRMNIGQILEAHLGWAAHSLGFRAVSPVFAGADDDQIEAELSRAWLINWAWRATTKEAWEFARANQIDTTGYKDDYEVICAYLVACGSMPDDADQTSVRRSALAYQLRKRGISPDIMVYEDDPREEAELRDADEQARRCALQIWLEEQGVTDGGEDLEALKAIATRISLERGVPPPYIGKMRLIDGRTGEPFDRPVCVGYMSMMKLVHMVDDKIHARSTGPYSMITQQPLGGRARFGGQRLGEMEVWALEAYGAAHTLQEMLTIKSDDIDGRTAAFESIVRGLPVGISHFPASFHVLVKELQGLGFSVEAIDTSGGVVTFGKEERKMQHHQLGGFGLQLIAD